MKAKGQHLSNHQRKIVNRYYEHLDTITITKLQELVSDLYLCESAKKRDQLWKRVETALGKMGPSESRVRKILDEQDVENLAGLVGELAGK